jgi:beta-phosphoglucomutase-like phosphatase (HAD superfamily)
MTLKAVIFDVDGTLADTEDAHRLAFNATFRDFRLPWEWDVPLYRELLPCWQRVFLIFPSIPLS